MFVSPLRNLADTQNRGSLDQTDFIIGMHFIQLAMSQPTFTLPNTMPPGLYEQASGGRPPQAVRTHATGGSSGTHSPSLSGGFGSPIRPNYTGQGRVPQPLSAQNTGQALQSPQHAAAARHSMAPSTLSNFSVSSTAQSTTGAWDISPQEKAAADGFYATLDTQKRGYVEGDVAVPFMVKSGLPEAVLAQIW